MGHLLDLALRVDERTSGPERGLPQPAEEGLSIGTGYERNEENVKRSPARRLREWAEVHDWPRLVPLGGLSIGPGRAAWEARLAVLPMALADYVLREALSPTPQGTILTPPQQEPGESDLG
jgi:hypothetical protein